MASEKKQSVLNGAMILMAAVLLVKLIGVLFKMPLSNMIGSVGRGYFSSAYEIYTPIFAIAMAGLPVAVSRMVAANVELNHYREARAVFKVSQKIFLIVGIVGTLVLFIASVPYAKITGKEDYLSSLPAIFVVAPSVFVCCYMSAYRGYYEGLRNMTPTAISQVIEALGKLFIGLALAKAVTVIGNNQYQQSLVDGVGKVFWTTVENPDDLGGAIAPWAAAAAIIGVTSGSALSLIFLMIYHKVKGDGFERHQLVNSPKPREGIEIAKEMIKFAIPMVVSALILNVTNIIDTTTIQARLSTALNNDFNAVYEMHRIAMDKAVALDRLNLGDMPKVVKYLWGAYGTALDFKTLIPTITIQLGVSALPALAAAWVAKNKREIRSTIETVLRVGMFIALPAGIGMACLATPIITILYGRGASSDSISIIAPIMAAYGFATPIVAISTPTTSMLQAIGRTDIPVKSVLVAAVCKVVCNFILVGNPKINVYGAVVGTIVFYVVIVACNLISLIRISKVKVRWASVFVKPLICSILCGVTAFATHGLISAIFKPDTTQSIVNMDTVGTIIGIGLGAVVYAISLLLIKGIAKEDVAVLPKGEKIAKMLEKYGLLG